MVLAPAVVPGASETKTCGGGKRGFRCERGKGGAATRWGKEGGDGEEGMRRVRWSGRGGWLGVASSHSRRSGWNKAYWSGDRCVDQHASTARCDEVTTQRATAGPYIDRHLDLGVAVAEMSLARAKKTKYPRRWHTAVSRQRRRPEATTSMQGATK